MKRVKNILFLLLLTVITILLCEIVCRVYGLKPYNTKEVKFEYKPKLPGKPDAIYGHSLVPGYFTLIKNDTFVYHATHDEHCRRITSYDTSAPEHTDKLIVLGCSFTYGDGIEDSMTHPFILQQLLNKSKANISVENRGVGGYCPAQFYLQAQEIIKDSSVKYVVINYADVQDERTICSRNWRKAHVKYTDQLKYQKLIGFPYFTEKDGKLVLDHKSMSYSFLPLQKQLALVEYIDNIYCRFETRHARDISEKAIKLTADMLRKKGIKVILAPITGDESSIKMINDLGKQGYDTLLYGINTGDNEYNLNPADGHPNYRANKIFADKLYAKICSLRKSQ